MLTYLSENVTVFVSRRRVSRSCQRNEIEYMHTQQVCNYVANQRACSNDDESDDENTIWKLLPPSLAFFAATSLATRKEGMKEPMPLMDAEQTAGRAAAAGPKN